MARYSMYINDKSGSDLLIYGKRKKPMGFLQMKQREKIDRGRWIKNIHDPKNE